MCYRAEGAVLVDLVQIKHICQILLAASSVWGIAVGARGRLKEVENAQLQVAHNGATGALAEGVIQLESAHVAQSVNGGAHDEHVLPYG